MDSAATKTQIKAGAYGNNHSFTNLKATKIEQCAPFAKDVATNNFIRGVRHSEFALINRSDKRI